MEEESKNDDIIKKPLIEQIPPNLILNSIFPYMNKENKYKYPLLLTYLDTEFIENLKTEANTIIKDKKNKNENNKNMVNDFIILYDFFYNCKLAYKEQVTNFKENLPKMIDPLEDILNKAEKETNNIINCSLNYKKYFYNFFMTLPCICISPCASIMNIIYLKEYYKLNKKQKIDYVILYIHDEVAKCRINDLFEEILFDKYNLVIGNRKISFDFKIFSQVISHIYKLFDINTRIIINSGNISIKQNFKNLNEFIIDSILFKIKYISNSLILIYRV